MGEIIKQFKWFGDVLLLITALVWGGGFIGVVGALEHFSPFYMIALRFGIASVLMLVLFWKKLKSIKKEELMPGILCGCFLFIGFAFQTTGALYVSVGKLAFLTALNVIMVPFIARVWFKEKIKSYNMVASLIAIVGFAFLNLTKEAGFAIGKGELIGIACAIGFALHIGLLGHVANRMDPIKLAVLQMMTCTVLGLVCALIFEKPPTDLSVSMLMPVAYLGVFSTFIAFLCQTIGQKYASASRAAIILSMESVFGILLSVMILKEVVTGAIMIGASLILLAVIVAEVMHAREEAQAALVVDALEE